ncbi:MAG: mycothiol maleylpyruvate isomerase, partial [Mycolicibacterium neoaurum]|nr:mycothiol maleylpyruvate isomerase [Mycolicibacterium neoaurum]
ARATGLDADLPIEAVEQAGVLATRVAVRLGHGETVLAALTGRTNLPPGYSVV